MGADEAAVRFRKWILGVALGIGINRILPPVLFLGDRYTPAARRAAAMEGDHFLRSADRVYPALE